MSAEKLSVQVGPRKHIWTKHYGKFRVETYLLTLHKTVVYEMEGYIAIEHIDAYIDDLLALATELKPVGMIADPRKAKVLSPEFQKAIQTRFWPGIAKLGIKRNPGIVPPSALTQTSVRRMVTTAGQTIRLDGGYEMEIALFETFEDCVEWISMG